MARQVDIVLTLNAAGVVTGGKAGAAGVKGIEKQAKQAEKALVQMGRQGQNMGKNIERSMRSGRRGALAFNRVIQDAPFGLIAIQNNITELAGSFTVLRQNGESAGGAIKAILREFKGPGGFLLIISLATSFAVAFGSRIVDAFTRAKTSTKELGEALNKLLTIQRDLTKFEEQAVNVEARLAVTRTLIKETTAEMNNILRLSAGATANLTQVQREEITVLRIRITAIKVLQEQLQEELKLNKSLALGQEILALAGFAVVEEEEKVTKVIKDQIPVIKEEITELQKLQMELAGLVAISIDEAVAIETSIRDINRQIDARRTLISTLTTQIEQQAILAREGFQVLPGAPITPIEEGFDVELRGVEINRQLIEQHRERAEAAEAARDAEVALAESAVLSAAASVEAGDNVLQATLGVVRDIIQARLAQAIAGAVASSSILGPIAGAAAGALMAVLFNQLMPSGHKGSSGGAGASARADTTSTLGVGLGGIRVQNRGFTTGATGAAASARAQTVTIRVIEPDLFRLNTELSNADGVRDQVGSI